MLGNYDNVLEVHRLQHLQGGHQVQRFPQLPSALGHRPAQGLQVLPADRSKTKHLAICYQEHVSPSWASCTSALLLLLIPCTYVHREWNYDNEQINTYTGSCIGSRPTTPHFTVLPLSHVQGLMCMVSLSHVQGLAVTCARSQCHMCQVSMSHVQGLNITCKDLL